MVQRQRPGGRDAKTGERLYRRSPHVVCYWYDGTLVFENYAEAVRISASPLTCLVLDFFDGWRSAAQLAARFPSYDAESLREAVSSLAGHSLLQTSDRRPSRRESAMSAWKLWNPAAGFFHSTTKDVPYAPEAGIRQRLRRRVAQSRPPPLFKRYPGAPTTALAPPRTDGDFPRVLLARRTWRRFAAGPIDKGALATLLGLSWGVQRFMRVARLGRVPLKTSPSGGARHSLEAYVLALRVKGLARGLYHYSPDRHALELLSASAGAREAAAYLPSQSWYASAAALVLMTSVFPRVQWRYDTPRAYRAVLLEAGHFCQSFCLVATWLGLAPFCSMALADSRIERDLGIDGTTESVLYAAGVGARPTGVERARRPRTKTP